MAGLARHLSLVHVHEITHAGIEVAVRAVSMPSAAGQLLQDVVGTEIQSTAAYSVVPTVVAISAFHAVVSFPESAQTPAIPSPANTTAVTRASTLAAPGLLHRYFHKVIGSSRIMVHLPIDKALTGGNKDRR